MQIYIRKHFENEYFEFESVKKYRMPLSKIFSSKTRPFYYHKYKSNANNLIPVIK